MSGNRRIVLARRPVGAVRDEDFELRVAPVPEPRDGEFVVRVCWLGFDPAQRGWLDDVPSYITPVALGEVVRAAGVGEVVASRNGRFPVDVMVSGTFGWQEYALTDGSGAILPVRKIADGVPPTAALGVLGTTGLTAYFGLLDVGRVKGGDTVLVSAAAGATGSVVGQIARIAGARAIGIAGGAEKCAWLTEVAGFDAAIDYKSEDVVARIRDLAPAGVDLYYDNVGGAILDAALANLAHGASVVLCGAISTRYATDGGSASGIHNLTAVIARSARMQGFLVGNYAERHEEALEQLARWIRDCRILVAEDIQHGPVEHAPATLRRVFEGRNLGKQILQIAEPSAP